MSDVFDISRVRKTLALILISAVLAACGGGGGGSPGSNSPPDPVVPPPTGPETGTVGLWLTDAATDDLAEINLDLTEAILIGDDGQRSIFEGNARINLLALENYGKPIAFGEVPVGHYNKLRLRIDNVELVNFDDEVFPVKLPANGKIDLLDQDGFDVFPGRTLLATIDIDAKKSIHLVGNNNGYRIRPVVKVNFMDDGGLPDKLTRLEGRVDEILDATTGAFVLCSFDDPDSCLDVVLADGGCIYDENGQPTTPDMLAVDQEVVVIGRFRREDDDDGDNDSDSDESRPDIDVVLEAIAVELGDASQTRGTVNSKPGEDGTFILIDRDGNEITVELQKDCTRVFGPDGEITDGSALQIGVGIEIEGVIVPPATEGDPMLLRAAIILLDGDDANEQISGTIADPVQDRGFILMTSGGDVCVAVADEADILLVSSDGTEQKDGAFEDLEAGQEADVFGELGVEGCFLSDELVVTLPGALPE
jgi:hypothetical protein